MGRVNQAMRRARQSGIATEFEPIAVSAYDASVLAAEPFPAEAASDGPKIEASSHHDDGEIKKIFFNTYFDKVWSGPHKT